MPSHRFPKRLRLLSPKEFERVFAARVSASDSWLVLYGVANAVGHPRLGLTVPRRVGSAVERNRWKRLLRESFRLSQNELPAIDYVCVPRSNSPPELRQLKESFPVLAQRLVGKLQSRARAVQPAKSAPSAGRISPAVEPSL
jgi:ribonuclease P protein component